MNLKFFLPSYYCVLWTMPFKFCQGIAMPKTQEQSRDFKQQAKICGELDFLEWYVKADWQDV